MSVKTSCNAKMPSLQQNIGESSISNCSSSTFPNQSLVRMNSEPLPGHTMHFVAPLQIQNLLPIDAEFNINGSVVAIGAGKQVLFNKCSFLLNLFVIFQIQLTSVDITKSVKLQLSTDRLSSKYPITILKSQIGEGQLLHIRFSFSL